MDMAIDVPRYEPPYSFASSCAVGLSLELGFSVSILSGAGARDLPVESFRTRGEVAKYARVGRPKKTVERIAGWTSATC